MNAEAITEIAGWSLFAIWVVNILVLLWSVFKDTTPELYTQDEISQMLMTEPSKLKQHPRC